MIMYVCMHGKIKDAWSRSSPRMKELLQAGVKFRRTDMKGLFSLTFKGRVLEIPKLDLYEGSVSIICNILALEQCYGEECESYMNDYIVFMDRLIDTPEDVQYLYQKGIIGSLSGSSIETAYIFNEILGKGAAISSPANFHFLKLSKDLNEFCEARCNKWWTELKEAYFASPLVLISSLAAVSLIFLGIMQTVLTILK